MRHSLAMNEAPLLSHVLYAWSGALDDNKPTERELGMRAGFAWGSVADGVVVYTDYGISPGMREGIGIALKRSIKPIEYRSIGVNREEL